jgi:hypothetical protein
MEEFHPNRFHEFHKKQLKLIEKFKELGFFPSIQGALSFQKLLPIDWMDC